MTKVLMVRDGSPSTGWWYTVEATGHSTGSVELCAAVSTLMQTLSAWLDLRGAAVSERVIESGRCKLRFSGHRCDTAFEVIYAGFMGLQATDPRRIKVELRKK